MGHLLRMQCRLENSDSHFPVRHFCHFLCSPFLPPSPQPSPTAYTLRDTHMNAHWMYSQMHENIDDITSSQRFRSHIACVNHQVGQWHRDLRGKLHLGKVISCYCVHWGGLLCPPSSLPTSFSSRPPPPYPSYLLYPPDLPCITCPPPPYPLSWMRSASKPTLVDNINNIWWRGLGTWELNYHGQMSNMSPKKDNKKTLPLISHILMIAIWFYLFMNLRVTQECQWPTKRRFRGWWRCLLAKMAAKLTIYQLVKNCLTYDFPSVSVNLSVIIIILSGKT